MLFGLVDGLACRGSRIRRRLRRNVDAWRYRHCQQNDGNGYATLAAVIAFPQFALAQPEKDHGRHDQNVQQAGYHAAEHRSGQWLVLHIIGSNDATTVETVMTFGRNRSKAPSVTASISEARVS